MKFLIVDDDLIWLELVKLWLKKLCIDCDIIQNGYEAINLLQQNKYDLMITDISMPEMSGVKLIDYSIKHKYNINIAVMSNSENYLKQINTTKHKFLKPMLFEDFKAIIEIISL